jgi:hypothetical protein
MLVLLLVYKTRASDRGLAKRIYNIDRYTQRWTMNFAKGRDIADGQSQMIDGVASSCSQSEDCKSCPARSAPAEAVL